MEKVKLDEPKAKLTLTIRDREGNVVEVEDDCLFVAVGKQQLGDLMRGDAAGKKITHYALGDNGTTPTLSDTALLSEKFREAIDTTSRTGSTVTITCILEYAEGNGSGSQVYREAGLFNDPTAGQMYVRANFPDKTKTGSVQWTLEWQIVFG